MSAPNTAVPVSEDELTEFLLHGFIRQYAQRYEFPSTSLRPDARRLAHIMIVAAKDNCKQ